MMFPRINRRPRGGIFGAVFWWGLAAFTAGLYVLTLFTDAKPLQEFLRLLNVSFALGVVAAYLPETLRRSMKRRLESSDLLLLGITIGWFGQAFVSGWVLLWRLAGQPAWMINSDVINVAVAIQVAGCMLHLIAPGAINGVVPRRNMIAVGFLTALATGLLIVFIAESESIAPLLRRMKPLIDTPRSNYDATSLRPFRELGNPLEGPVVFIKG